MEDIKKGYEECAAEAEAFYSDNQQMITDLWQKELDA